MKKTKTYLTRMAAAVLMTLPVAVSCNDFFRLEQKQDGGIQTAFLEDAYLLTKAAIREIPDTNDFLLDIRDAKGNSLYSGAYGAAPQSVIASPGTYSVSAVSGEFKTPAFSAPQYGDCQTAEVKSGDETVIRLMCRQTNSGVRLQISPSFLTQYPNGSLFLKSKDGKLMYGYSEKRIAYFNPGQVTLMLSDGGKDRDLLTRDLGPRDVLTLNISVASSAAGSPAATSGNICIQIDTTRNWSAENYVIGDGSSGGGSTGGKGSSPDTAMGISLAKDNIGAEDVWVYGYIVGGDLSSSKASFTAPFTSNTNIVIAAKSTEKDKANCMSVQLQKGEIRNALNLMDNPGLKGRSVYLKGDIVASYYGIPGIQNITQYEIR